MATNPFPFQIVLVTLVTAAGLGAADLRESSRSWPVYGGDFAGTKYSALDQINRGNVTRLKPAWIFRWLLLGILLIEPMTWAKVDGWEADNHAAAFKTWLFSITVNVCRTRLHRQKRRGSLQQILQSLFVQNQAHPENEAIQSETDSALWQAVHALDDKHRIIVILRYYHDLPVNEIAETLGVPVGTVHSRLNHARERLRTLLKEEPR
jgi:RNA polymerase sigma factor (sigma-70 family)